MSRPIPVALLALALLALPLTPALAAPVPQNDANSGADAPDSHATALRLPGLGTYRGQLTAPADTEDWYLVYIGSALRLKVTLATEASTLETATLPSAVLEVRTPGNTMASMTWSSPSITGTTDVVITTPGWWAVRVTPDYDSTGGNYRFTLASETLPAVAASQAGNGYLLFGFTITKTGTVEWRANTALDTANARTQLEFHTLDASLNGYWSKFLSTGNGEARLTANDENLQTSLWPGSQGGSSRGTIGTSGYEYRPGTYYVLVMMKAGGDAYTSITASLTGDAKSLGFTRGTEADLRALAHTDFQGSFAVTSPMVRAGDVAATADVATRFFGNMNCESAAPDCRVGYPTGSVVTAPNGYLEIRNGPAGRYTFTVSEEATFATDYFIVFGADLRLPGGR
ncbi:MAG TPA: hypothetical protein VNZ52_00090 [Candidatus Thermoplasmatota archaeon]|nr:hypothetical protein [Candidatus Thermoplasmatota archaeon]